MIFVQLKMTRPRFINLNNFSPDNKGLSQFLSELSIINILLGISTYCLSHFTEKNVFIFMIHLANVDQIVELEQRFVQKGRSNGSGRVT